jgi:hypothetical protein
MFMAHCKPEHLRRMALTLAVIGTAAHLTLLLRLWQPESFQQLLFPFIVTLPWLLLAACAVMSKGRVTALLVCIFAELLFMLVATWFYWGTLGLSPNAPGGVVFIEAPVIATSIASVMLLVILLQRRRSGRSPQTPL